MTSPGPQGASGGASSGASSNVTTGNPGNPGNFTVRGVHITSSGKRPKAAGFTPSGPNAKPPTKPVARKPVSKSSSNSGGKRGR